MRTNKRRYPTPSAPYTPTITRMSDHFKISNRQIISSQHKLAPVVPANAPLLSTPANKSPEKILQPQINGIPVSLAKKEFPTPPPLCYAHVLAYNSAPQPLDMAAKNPQNEAVVPAKMPSYYDDDFAQRCFPHRFRRVGNPYAYLNEIGIHAMVEFISKGHLLIDVAEATNVPLMVLRRWVQNEGHLEAIEEAETLSAEGYLAEGMKRIRTAQTEFELRRAKEMVKHAQYMASKKNKPMYGEQVQKAPGAAVSYVFNIPGGTAESMPKFAGQIIDATANRVAVERATDEVPRVGVNLGQIFGIATDQNDVWTPPTLEGVDNISLEHLSAMDADEVSGPQLVLVADRPANPTAENPDIGPFFEEV